MLGLCMGDVADFWSLGVILYELYTGASFKAVFPKGLLTHTPVTFTCSTRDADLEDLVSLLLRPNPADRLGCGGIEGQKAVKGHPFFKQWQWATTSNKS